MHRIVLAFVAFFVLCGFSTMENVQQLIRDGRESEGLRLSMTRAEARDPEGYEALAWFYDEGRVVARDYRKAAELFRRAAEAGLRHSQWRLGVMLDLGEGVEADPEQAFRWLARSAEQGYAKAMVSMGVMHATGRGTPVDYTKAMQFYLRAAAAGEPHGYYGVGILYARGEGVREDEEEALAWLGAAAFLGDEEAKRVFGALESDGADADKIAKRIESILKANKQVSAKPKS